MAEHEKAPCAVHAQGALQLSAGGVEESQADRTGSSRRGSGGETGAASRSTIRNAWLRVLPPVHARPIHLLVWQGSYPVDPVGSLIFRRASRLDAFSAYPYRTSATQRCSWRNNWYTGGPSVPVLSY